MHVQFIRRTGNKALSTIICAACAMTHSKVMLLRDILNGARLRPSQVDYIWPVFVLTRPYLGGQIHSIVFGRRSESYTGEYVGFWICWRTCV